MTTFLLTSISGWMAAVLVLAALVWPYLSRYRLRHAVFTAKPGYFQLLRPHFLLGYVTLIIALFHLLVAMRVGMAGGVRLVGPYVAGSTVMLILVQVLLGRRLRCGGIQPALSGIRRWHFLTMLAIVTLVLVHVEQNSVLIGSWLAR